MKKFLTLAVLIIAILGLAACNNGVAPLAPNVPDENVYDPYYGKDVTDGDYNPGDAIWPGMDDQGEFGSISGTVVEVSTEYSYPPTHIFRLEGENGIVNFIADFNTFILGEMPVVGDTITGFFSLDMPMAMIYPPQYNLSVIVNGDFNNVAVDRFDGDLVSFDGNLKLEIGADTEIILQDGEPFDCILAGRKLVVVYDISTRSIPAITTPSQVIVLFERFATGPAFL